MLNDTTLSFTQGKAYWCPASALAAENVVERFGRDVAVPTTFVLHDRRMSKNAGSHMITMTTSTIMTASMR